MSEEIKQTHTGEVSGDEKILAQLQALSAEQNEVTEELAGSMTSLADLIAEKIAIIKAERENQ